jgi:hypothetical protein
VAEIVAETVTKGQRIFGEIGAAKGTQAQGKASATCKTLRQTN